MSPRPLVISVALALLVSSACDASAITFVVRVPASTPGDAAIWLSGDRAELGGWNGSGLRLVRAADGSFVGSLPLPEGTAFEFKVTRGSWDTVEKDAAGGEIANRHGHVAGGADTLRIAVAAWRDQATERPTRTPTVTGELRKHTAFASEHVPARDVLVWLPPGYSDKALERYPVVYFHDGQNVFDGATSFIPGQEWRADEVADSLIRAGRIPRCILVAVANTSARLSEYTSIADARRGGGGSAAYFRFLVEELKPFIDRTYHTHSDPARTAVIGSSLGGLAALDLGLSHPEHFGLIGCVSPSVGWADSAIVRRVRAGARLTLRIWLDMGTDELVIGSGGQRDWLRQARELHGALLGRGWREGVDLHYEEVAGARHNEAAWAARIDRILYWLLGPLIER